MTIENARAAEGIAADLVDIRIGSRTGLPRALWIAKVTAAVREGLGGLAIDTLLDELEAETFAAKRSAYFANVVAATKLHEPGARPPARSSGGGR